MEALYAQDESLYAQDETTYGHGGHRMMLNIHELGQDGILDYLSTRELPGIGVWNPMWLDGLLGASVDRCMTAVIRQCGPSSFQSFQSFQTFLDLGSTSPVWNRMLKDMDKYHSIWDNDSHVVEHLLYLGATPHTMSALMRTEIWTLAIWFEIRSLTLSLITSPNISWDHELTIPGRPSNIRIPYPFTQLTHEPHTWLPIFFMIQYSTVSYNEMVLETSFRRNMARIHDVFHQTDKMGRTIWGLVFAMDGAYVHPGNPRSTAVIPASQSMASLLYRMVHRYTRWFDSPEMNAYIDMPESHGGETPFQLFCRTRYPPTLTKELWSIIVRANPTWDLADKYGRTALFYAVGNKVMTNVWMNQWLRDGQWSVIHADQHGVTPFHHLVISGQHQQAHELYHHIRARDVPFDMVIPESDIGLGTFIHRMPHTSRDEYYTELVKTIVESYATHPDQFQMTNSCHNTLIMECIKHRKLILVETLAEVCPHYFQEKELDLLRGWKTRGVLSPRLAELFPNL